MLDSAGELVGVSARSDGNEEETDVNKASSHYYAGFQLTTQRSVDDSQNVDGAEIKFSRIIGSDDFKVTSGDMPQQSKLSRLSRQD